MSLTSRGGATSLAQIAVRGACVKYYNKGNNIMTTSMIIVTVGVIAMLTVGTIMAIIATWEF